MIANLVLASLMLDLGSPLARAEARLDAIQRRGVPSCGVEPGVAGFAEVDARGRYRGLDIDVCRAVAAAIFGTPDGGQVRHGPDGSGIPGRRRDRRCGTQADVGAQARGTARPARRSDHFHDGQGFLDSKALNATTPRQIAGSKICVAAGTGFELNLGAYFKAHALRLQKVLIESPRQFDEIAER